VVEAIGKLAAVFAEYRIVRVIHNGLINLIPFVLVGAICVALLNLPIPVYQDLLDTLFAGRWQMLSQLITFASLDIIALATLLSVAYVYAAEEPTVKNGDIHPFIPTFTALACYVIFFVWDGAQELVFKDPGETSIFPSLAVALLATWLFFVFVKLWARFKPPRLSNLDTNLQMRSAFRAVFPVAATLLIFALARIFASAVIPTEEIGAALVHLISEGLVSDNLGSVLLTVFLSQFLWFFGVHGSGLILAEFPLVSTLPTAAQTMFATQDFYLNFVSLGGSGTTFGLLIALFLVGSEHRGKRLAKASVFPSLFNINEIFIYGIPLILNPFLLAPFILAPLLTALLCFIAFSVGLVPPIVYPVEWTCPILFSGFLSTGSLAGSALQLLCLGCAVVIYLPFIIATRHFDARRRLDRVQKMQAATLETVGSEGSSVLARNDTVGETAREISSRLYGYFETNTLPFHLVYQPKTNKDGRLMGAEALLRWVHPEFGALSPVVLVEICDESGLASKLGRWVTREAIREYARWKQEGLCGMRLSINLHARHLCEDPGFPAFLGGLLASQGVGSGEIELEITEHLALHANQTNKDALANIRKFGVELSIDDMGIGYSSLTYISDFGVKGVKIDTSLVSAIDSDIQQQEIVGSIVQLAKQMNLTVIVEGVETKDQLDALVALDVPYFQGYYFSKPLISPDFIAYAHEHGIIGK
jgi:lactose/cellobiose-specific phosphotransferase system IIC component